MQCTDILTRLHLYRKLGPLYVRAHSRTALFGEEKIKFKIYSDGRVEETVIGVAGENCLKVTEKLNEKLGKVVTTKPTEEMSKEVAREKVNVYEQNKSEW